MANFYKGFYPRWSNQITDSLVEAFGLNNKKRLIEFSKGMHRQVAIIMALSSRPKYLLLDELFDGIDPIIRSIIRKLMLELIANTETIIIVSSHNIKELENLCDHIGIINHHKIVYEKSINDLSAQRCHYKIVTEKQVSQNLFDDIDCRNLQITGNIITMIASSNDILIDNILSPFNPILIDKIPLTLEEIFLNEMEVNDYDFTGLFEKA